MSIVIQGTQMYVLSNSIVSEVECITSFSPGSNPTSQIKDACLSETNTRSYKEGLHTPGQATVALNIDPANDSHIMLSNLAESSDQTNLTSAINWTGGADELAVATSDDPDTVDGFPLPDTRTRYALQGYVSDFPFDFQVNTVVQTSATVQRSGQGVWVPKAQSTS